LTQQPIFSKLENVGVVVANADVAANYWESFGVGPFREVPGNLLRAPDGMRTFRAMIGEVGLELIEPGGGESLWRRTLDEKGEGIVHLGFAVSDLEAGRKWGEGSGLKTLYARDFSGGGLIGFDARVHGGVVIELSKYPPGAFGADPRTGAPYAFIHHVGFVTGDIDGTVKYYEGLGFGPFAPLKLQGERIERTMYGKPTPYRLKNSGTHIGATKVELEFLQPLESAPVQENFLVKRGEGANHFGFKVGDADAEAAKLSEKGFDIIMTVAFTSGTKCKYVDTSAHGGLLVEFWEPPKITA
jgi:catechol 2,3-dioxygenase-like lactoylglutathione lyase family enzyme